MQACPHFSSRLALPFLFRHDCMRKSLRIFSPHRRSYKPFGKRACACEHARTFPHALLSLFCSGMIARENPCGFSLRISARISCSKNALGHASMPRSFSSHLALTPSLRNIIPHNMVKMVEKSFFDQKKLKIPLTIYFGLVVF